MRSLPFGHCCASAGAASATVSAAMPATAIHFQTRIVDLLLLDWVTAGVLVSRVRTIPARLGPRLLCRLRLGSVHVDAASRWKIEWDGTLLCPLGGVKVTPSGGAAEATHTYSCRASTVLAVWLIHVKGSLPAFRWAEAGRSSA